MIHRQSIVKIVSKTFFLPTIVLLLSTMSAWAQTETIKFKKTRLTAREAFTQIQEQTTYGTAFNGRLFDASRTVDLPAAEMTLDTAMHRILSGTGFSYVLSCNVISITKDAAEPVKEVTVVRERKPVTNDVYRRNSFSDLTTAPRRRPTATTLIVEEAPQPARPETLNYMLTSRTRPVEQYVVNQGMLPNLAIKTNLLYGAGTLTPNLALEVGLGRRTSLELSASYNPWKLSGSLEKNKKLVHMIIKPEFRYWLCERYNGHFFGADAIFGRYNIGSYDVPMLFDKEYRYDGIAVGGGVTYGYHLMLGKKWGLEFAVGAGVLWLKYDRYDCVACDRNGIEHKKVYLGPTNAAINLVFLIK